MAVLTILLADHMNSPKLSRIYTSSTKLRPERSLPFSKIELA